LRGRSYARRVTRTDLEFAMQMFENAVALDPDFALAHAWLANVQGLFFEWHEHDARWVERGLASCERALSLDPQLADALAARARIAWAQDKYDEAIHYARQAIERKPDCEGAYWTLGQAYFATDQLQEAAALAERATESTGDDYNVYIPYTLVFERLGEADSVRTLRERQTRALERQLEMVPEDVRAGILLAVNHAKDRREAEADRELRIAIALRPKDTNILYNAACVYGILQKKAEALATLQKAKDAGYRSLDWAARDPDLDCLRGDPEFERLIRKEEQKG